MKNPLWFGGYTQPIYLIKYVRNRYTEWELPDKMLKKKIKKL